jgi:hypothetical protein
MTNPVTPFRNDIFGSRGMDIQEALNYTEILINTLCNTDQVAVRTSIGVLLNTIEKAVTQSQGPSPEKLAIIDLIDERIAKHNFIREEDFHSKVMDSLANEDISDDISNWMSNNFDLNDYNVDDAIESWADNNLDDKITEAVNNLSFTVEVSR